MNMYQLFLRLAAIFALSFGSSASAQSCFGDINHDGTVEAADLAQLLSDWGECQGGVASNDGQSCASDINANGIVDAVDLAQVLSSWGTCPTSIASVTPLHGSFVGGTFVTVTGTNLSATTGVRVGTYVCSNVQVLSPTVVTAITPFGTVGEAPIVVVSAVGSTFAPLPFTYVMQSISSVSPNNGEIIGGTEITITGTHLGGATSVRVGGVAATNVVSVNSTTVTAVTPAGPLGAATVEVTSAKGTTSAPIAFTYTTVGPWATTLEFAPNPAVVTDAAFRARIIATGLPWRVRDNASNIELLLVPPGVFYMGQSSNSPEWSIDESPRHQVELTAAFYLGKTEVTQAEWQAEMGTNPSFFIGHRDSPSRPVERVSWNMIQPFCAQNGLRLPTEAEWEYACRGGNQSSRYGPVDDIAWYSGNAAGETHVVAGKLSNAIGLYDMIGNVWEWNQDWYGPYSNVYAIDPSGPMSGLYRVLRGASWGYTAWSCRAAARGISAPSDFGVNSGFRVARTP